MENMIKRIKKPETIAILLIIQFNSLDIFTMVANKSFFKKLFDL
jgi:hypothetical protein